jgi:hypothetical protein
MRSLIIPFILLILTSCFWNRPDRYLSKDEKIANQITFSIAKKLEKEKGLTFAGFGGGMEKGLKVMMLALEAPEAFDIRKGREMIVECAEIYLNAINNNLKIRPYLHNYPFTYKNIEIEIYESSKIKKSQIACANLKRGKIYYCIEIDSHMEISFEEPYENAVKKLKEEKVLGEIH